MPQEIFSRVIQELPLRNLQSVFNMLWDGFRLEEQAVRDSQRELQGNHRANMEETKRIFKICSQPLFDQRVRQLFCSSTVSEYQKKICTAPNQDLTHSDYVAFQLLSHEKLSKQELFKVEGVFHQHYWDVMLEVGKSGDVAAMKVMMQYPVQDKALQLSYVLEGSIKNKHQDAQQYLMGLPQYPSLTHIHLEGVLKATCVAGNLPLLRELREHPNFRNINALCMGFSLYQAYAGGHEELFNEFKQHLNSEGIATTLHNGCKHFDEERMVGFIDQFKRLDTYQQIILDELVTLVLPYIRHTKVMQEMLSHPTLHNLDRDGWLRLISRIAYCCSNQGCIESICAKGLQLGIDPNQIQHSIREGRKLRIQ